jgi:lipopolysaccharide export system permease protein
MISFGRRGIRQPYIVWRYLAKEFLIYFLVSFLFFFLAFLINQILYMAKQLLSKHAAPFDILRLLLFAIPSYVALAFPFAALVGALMSVGRLNSDNEILVMEASGISLKRIFAPFLIAGLLLSSMSFVVNDIFLPLGTIEFNKLYRKLVYSMPAMELKPYSVNSFQSITIVTGEVDKGVMREIMIIDSPEVKKQRTITASSAVLSKKDEAAGVISFDLKDVFVITTDLDKKDRFEYSRSDSMVYNILVKDFVESIMSVTAREMSSRDLKKAIVEKESALELKLRDKERRSGDEIMALRTRYSGLASSIALTSRNAWAGIRDDYNAFVKSSHPTNRSSITNASIRKNSRSRPPPSASCSSRFP